MKWIRAAQIVFVMLCLFSTTPLTRNQEFARRDGDWWRGIDRVHKGYYLSGLLDGIELGNQLSLAGIDKDKESYKEMSSTLSSQHAKYVAHVTVIQLADRLDAFYDDSTNRRILAHDAAWLVLNQIAGTPEAQMHALIESYRKSAARE